MAKKRRCRRTEDEIQIHEKAVKWRKMTDEQLVHYVEDRVNKSWSEGYNSGLKEGAGSILPPPEPDGSGKDAGEFIGILQTEKIQGIGAVTVNKIVRLARERGFIE